MVLRRAATATRRWWAARSAVTRRVVGALTLLPVPIAVSDCVASVLVVTGPSMQPTLNPPGGRGGDVVLVEKWSVKVLRRFTRGDVVVLWAPDNPHQQIIKRLLALEGDTVVEDAAARSWVELPPGRCWVEGDNRALVGGGSGAGSGGGGGGSSPASADSKSAFGPMHLGLLEGRVTHVVWPPARWGRVECRPQPERLLKVAGGDDGGGSEAAAAAAAV